MSVKSLPTLKAGETYIGSYKLDGKVVRTILLPDADQVLTWDGAMSWAKRKNASLPNKIECKMLREEFYDEFFEAVYWTCDPMPTARGTSAMAWGYCFDELGLLPELASEKRYARLVRREIEQPTG